MYYLKRYLMIINEIKNSKSCMGLLPLFYEYRTKCILINFSVGTEIYKMFQLAFPRKLLLRPVFFNNDIQNNVDYRQKLWII